MNGVNRFIITPKPGNKVKVYLKEGVSYGIVRRITQKQDLKEKNKQVEVVVLEMTDKKFELRECDFFLEQKRVLFEI